MYHYATIQQISNGRKDVERVATSFGIQNVAEGVTMGSSDEDKERPSFFASEILDVNKIDDFLVELLIPDWIRNHLLRLEVHWPVRLDALLSAFLGFLTIVHSNGQTPATRSLGLKLVNKKGASDGESFRLQLVLYAMMRTLLPHLVDLLVVPTIKRWESTSSGFGEDGRTQRREALAIRRRKLVANMFHEARRRLIPFLRLSCLILCWQGSLKSSGLAMFLCGLHYRKERQTKLHVDYAHRRWIQQEGLATMKSLFAGLWMLKTWKPLLMECFVEPVVRTVSRLQSNRSDQVCPVCLRLDHHIPFRMSCGHVYCYSCLRKVTKNQRPFRCRGCNKMVQCTQSLC